MDTKNGRRDFLRHGAGLGAAVALGGTRLAAREPEGAAEPAGDRPIDPVRVGFVGVGVKGSEHVANLLRIEGVELLAVCDVREEACAKAQAQAEALGKRKPAAYTRGERDFERMCQAEDLDLVYTATPWEWHVPVCLAAMRNGKHAATEIPAAITLDECWQLVEVSEQTGRYCMMMENVNYMREEMAILTMVRKGLLGELVHAEGAYEHDTRYLKIRDYGDGLWLGEHHARRNGNLYPPHGLGPIAWYLNINRGDRFDYLVSMSSNARGMDLYAREHLPEGHPKRVKKYINGDVNSSLIRTVNGLTIILKHDTDLPRPYSRTNLVQGTRRIVRRFPEFQVCLEGEDHNHKWEPGSKYLAEHEHPLWKRALERAAREPGTAGGDAGPDHGRVSRGLPPDPGAAGRCAAGLRRVRRRVLERRLRASEKSVADRSRPVDFPDFTRGRWRTNQPVRILGV